MQNLEIHTFKDLAIQIQRNYGCFRQNLSGYPGSLRIFHNSQFDNMF